MDISIQKILEYLKQKRGFEFSGYAESLIDRQITQRLNSNNLSSVSEYFSLIKHNPAELDLLIDSLIINVTQFFRDAITFAYLDEIIFPNLIHKKINNKEHLLRIWSAGCSTGEEPYSAAISINEEFKKNDVQIDVSIFATDFDKKILTKAKRAVFDFNSVKNIKYSLLKKYFYQKNKHYILHTEICDMVLFSFFNMLDQNRFSPPDSVYGDFDMIFCCNLLIYYEMEQQNLIFKKLYRSLAKNGYLVLGEAEIPVNPYRRYFRKLSDCCHIYQKIS